MGISFIIVVQDSEDEYEVPPGSAQGSSASHSAPRSPLPSEAVGHVGPEYESGSSVDSATAEPVSNLVNETNAANDTG